MINVTKPFLPEFSEYAEYLESVWKRGWLTNNGPLVNELELRLKDHLGIDHLLYLNNGTIALQLAIKVLGLKGDIITTPFSFVATTSSIVWEGGNPVFVDIDPKSLNIDPQKIEAAITEHTTGILATHVYGNPCEVDAIAEIARKHNLKVIYDAAHCFGTKYKGRSVFEYGDVSTTSFHATKLFHTIEGGAVFTKDPDLLRKMASMRNFGYNGPEEFDEVGVNGKNSEMHAAMGLCILNRIDDISDRRKELCQYYDERLQGLKIMKPATCNGGEGNYSYYPIVFEDGDQLLKSIEALNGHHIFPRRYFYPSLNTISYTTGKYSTPVSESISSRVLCLPLYYDLTKAEIDLICRVLLRTQKHG